MAKAIPRPWASLLLAAWLMMMLAGAAAAATIVNPDAIEASTSISVMPIRYDPYPAESGLYLRLWIKVENVATTPEYNARFILETYYPFTLDPSTPAEQNIGTMETSRQFVLEYKLTVDAVALTGEYNNSIWLKQCYNTACSSYARWPVSVFVRRPNPIFGIISAAYSPSPIVAGKPFDLTLSMQNSGSRVKDIVIGLNLSDLPFGPMAGSTERRLEAIDAGKNATVQFALMASGEATSGTYKVPVAISYYDEVGNAFTKSDILTLLVGGVPAIYLGAEDTAVFRKGAVADFIISIVNRGLVDVKFLTVRLLGGEGYRIISPSEMYIGNLESDDYETAKLKIFITGEAAEIVFPFELSYMDALNSEYEESEQLTYAVLTDEEAARFGLYTPDSGWVFFVILGLLVVYAIYRLRKKKPR